MNSLRDKLSLDNYKLILERFRSNRYQHVRYSEIDAKKRHFVLRHDLDMSLQCGVELAEIENSLNIRAYYFVLISTEM